jgi:hypothetical protein
MVYKDFYVQPENDLDEEFVDQEIDFLIKVSILERQEIKDAGEYAKIVKAKYINWLR